MPSTAKPTRICPNCQATFNPANRQCPVCKLETAKMDAFAAAKKAAQQKGLRTKVEHLSTPLYRRPLVWGSLLAAVLVALVIGHFTGAGQPPAWTRYPTTREDVARQLFTDIAVGDDPGYDKAYALIAPSARNPDDTEEQGHYRQLYHEVYKYLTGEFGSDWLSTLTVAPDPTNSDLMVVHVGLETFHVNTILMTPKDKLTDNNHHYATSGINEVDIADAAGFQQMEGALAVVGAEAGAAAVRNIQSVLGAAGARHRETPMQTKMRLSPLLRDPRGINKYEVYQTWPVRKDPVIRNRLDAISSDDRYAPDIKEVAKEVLQDRVSEEELIAAHVQTD